MANIFAAFSEPVRNCDALIAAAKVKKYPAKSTIVNDKDSGGSVHFILEGTVDITSFSSGGREVWHNRLKAGQHFGEMSAITGNRRSANVVAVTETTTAIISQHEYLRLVQDDRDLGFWLLKDLALRLDQSTRQIYELVALNVPKRICADLVRRTNSTPNENGEFPITPSPVLAQIARQLNTDRETISRAISALVKEGLVRRDGRKLIILDRDALIARAMD